MKGNCVPLNVEGRYGFFYRGIKICPIDITSKIKTQVPKG